ncbi:MAG: hypothetical protein F9B45_15225 [Phycisphaera sp. RhM]|nr:hypothetical protein [Phycisphaera sp. RhM]
MSCQSFCVTHFCHSWDGFRRCHCQGSVFQSFVGGDERDDSVAVVDYPNIAASEPTKYAFDSLLNWKGKMRRHCFLKINKSGMRSS